MVTGDGRGIQFSKHSFPARRLKKFKVVVAILYLGRRSQIAFETTPVKLVLYRFDEQHSSFQARCLPWMARNKHKHLCGVTEYLRFRPVAVMSESILLMRSWNSLR